MRMTATRLIFARLLSQMHLGIVWAEFAETNSCWFWVTSRAEYWYWHISRLLEDVGRLFSFRCIPGCSMKAPGCRTYTHTLASSFSLRVLAPGQWRTTAVLGLSRADPFVGMIIIHTIIFCSKQILNAKPPSCTKFQGANTIEWNTMESSPDMTISAAGRTTRTVKKTIGGSSCFCWTTWWCAFMEPTFLICSLPKK